MHLRRKRVFLGSLLVSVLALQGCKTNDSKKSEDTSGDRVGGFFDNDDKVRIKVPSELNNFTPTGKTEAKIMPQVTGLALAGSEKPTTSAGVEEIFIRCFTHDSLFIAKDWYFYAELLTNGKVIKTYNSRNVDQCNEMQLELKTLDKNTTYVVKASFFWKSANGQDTIVWYEGETQPFKPSDRNRQLVLEKLRVNQTVDVDVQKSDKDQCLARSYLWNGIRCLDGFNAISFVHTDFSDYSIPGSVPDSRKRKCLQIGDDQKAIQYECSSNAKQRLRTALHGVQQLEKELPPTEYGWFTIQFDAGKLCLTAKKDASGGDPYLTQDACKEGVPGLEQLFTLVTTQEGDKGGRNSFRVMNQFEKKALCLSVPPEKGDATGVAPLRNGAPVRLSLCATENANTRSSQFVRFVESTD